MWQRKIRWSEDDTIKFVKLYCAHNVLFDITLPEYRNGQARLAALHNIAKGMGIAGFSVNEARFKIKSLRNTYCQELKKIERCKSSNEHYAPSMKWFEIMDDALKRATQSPVLSAFNKSEYQQAHLHQDACQSPPLEQAAEDDDIVEVPVEESCYLLVTGPVLTTEMPMSEIESEQLEEPFPADTSCGQKRQRRSSFEDNADIRQLGHSRPPTLPQEDEFDAFGKYMALGLKNMPLHLALQCQNDLQTVLTRYRMRSLGPPLTASIEMSLTCDDYSESGMSRDSGTGRTITECSIIDQDEAILP